MSQAPSVSSVFTDTIVSGVFNETEAWPLMFKSANVVGTLPELQEVSESVVLVLMIPSSRCLGCLSIWPPEPSEILFFPHYPPHRRCITS